jgi:hypothetical protein
LIRWDGLSLGLRNEYYKKNEKNEQSIHHNILLYFK